MANKVIHTNIFERRYKRFLKKFRSLKTELSELEKELIKNPMIGEPLGNGLYKIRLANEDKNKGKSSGYRIVTYLVDDKVSFEIYFLIIYDKSEENTIKKPLLLKMVKAIF
jgi:hypothetical protein